MRAAFYALVIITMLLGCSDSSHHGAAGPDADIGAVQNDDDAGALGDAAPDCPAQAEICDQRDNDCDGVVDEQLSDCCELGTTRACGSAVGECRQGVQVCGAAGWGACTGGRGSTAEVCDGLDNDCDETTADGLDDTKLGQSCDGSDADSCADGVWHCSGGGLVCDDDADSKQESCDGKDNDCDGQVDEGCAIAPFTVSDYAVRGDGGSVLAGYVGDELWLMCANADGTLAREATRVVGVPPAANTPSQVLSLAGLDVARSRDSGRIALTYSYWNWPGSPYDWQNYIAFFDADCQLVAGPVALDSDLPNTGINRLGSVYMTNDGRSYVIYEHQTQNTFRVLGFDKNGTRIAGVSIASPSECAGGALGRELALDADSGAFTVVCESNGRSFRRYQADGTPVDAGFIQVQDSQPSPSAFQYFSGGRNPSGVFLYVGRNRAGTSAVPAARWILRAYGTSAQLAASLDIEGTAGRAAPLVRVTSRGDFLVELGGPAYELALISPDAQVLKTWPTTPGAFELDAQDHVYVSGGNGRVVRSPSIVLY